MPPEIHFLQALEEAYSLSSSAEDDFFYAATADDKYVAERKLKSAWSLVRQALKCANLDVLYLEGQETWERIRSDLFSAASSEYGDFYLIAAAELRWLVSTARKILVKEEPATAAASRSQLISLLKSAEHYVISQSFGWLPCREQDIDDRIEALLKTVYKTVNSDPSIPNRLKNYRPDTEIEELRTVIDYKFVENREAAKKIADELSADLLNYHDPRVTQIVFVVYETRRTMPVEDWQQHFDSKKPRTPATVVLLRGEPYTEEDKALSESRKPSKRRG